MTSEVPAQTAEGRLIEEAAKASGRSIRSLAANAGISDTHWRHVVRGWQPRPGGDPIPVKAPAMTLARMAVTLGLSADDLTEVDREDAAKLIPQVFRDYNAAVRPDTVRAKAYIPTPAVSTSSRPYPDEIDMIVASKTMDPREKLLRIRQVLELRAEMEAELQEMTDSAAAHEEAPADETGASDENLPEARPS